MDSKEGQKKKGLSQDLLLDDFFKPPIEEEPEEQKPVKKPAKETPISKPKQSIKKDLLLDDFFTPPPSVEESVKEKSQKEIAMDIPKEKPSIKEDTTYHEIKKRPAPPVIEPQVEKKPVQTGVEPPLITPPAQRSLKELLETPLFEEKVETPTPKQSFTSAPVPGAVKTPQPIVPVIQKKEKRGFPFVPVLGGILGVIVIGGVVTLILRHPKKIETEKQQVSRVETVVDVKPTQPPVPPPSEPPPERSTEQPQGAIVPIPEEAITPSQEAGPSPVSKEPASEKPIQPSHKETVEKKVASVNRYIVSAGPFRTKEEAKAQEIKLKILGYTPKITTGSETVEVYNLFVDPPVPEGEANVIRLKLSLKGFSAELVGAGGGNKRVKAGTFSSLTEAIEKKSLASELGYTVNIDISKSSQKVYNLEISFPESSAAKEAIKKIKDFGIEATMVEKKS